MVDLTVLNVCRCKAFACDAGQDLNDDDVRPRIETALNHWDEWVESEQICSRRSLSHTGTTVRPPELGNAGPEPVGINTHRAPVALNDVHLGGGGVDGKAPVGGNERA